MTASLAAPPREALTVDEGRALATLDVLLGVGRAEDLRGNATLALPLSQAMQGVAAQRIGVTVLRWLVEAGGYRTRLVLRDGRRASGRVWDPTLTAGFGPVFTSATTQFWTSAARVLPGMGAGTGSTDDDLRASRRVLRRMVRTDATASGDWVFFAIAQSALGAFTLPADDVRALGSRLREASPVATLLVPGPDDPTALRARLRPLADLPAVRLVECAEDRLAAAWVAHGRAAWDARAPARSLGERWIQLGRVQQAWLDVVDEAGRLDLARAVAKAVRTLVTRTLGGAADGVRMRLASTPGVRSIQDREGLFNAVGQALAPGVHLLRRRDEMAAERYGDARYEEAQVYVRDVDEILGPYRREILGLGRALTGEIG